MDIFGNVRESSESRQKSLDIGNLTHLTQFKLAGIGKGQW